MKKFNLSSHMTYYGALAKNSKATSKNRYLRLSILSTLLIVCMAFFAGNARAQEQSCDNSFTEGGSSDIGQLFSGQSFGQSFVASASCFSGNTFNEFTFFGQGNSSTNYTLQIFDGESVDSTNLRYSQTNISIAPPNLGGALTFAIEGGTGDRSFVDGQTYTFLLTLNGGNVIPFTSPSLVIGNAFFNGNFQNGIDLFFEISTIDLAPCENPLTNNRADGPGQLFTEQSFGQSILADASCYSGNTFTDITFFGQGNSTTNMTLQIFDGQSVENADLRYTQTGISLPPPNLGGPLSVTLQGGSGDLSFVTGQTYTFLLTLTGGNVIPFTSGNQVVGNAFFNDAFQDDEDFFFQINQTTPALEITGLSDIVQSNDEGACGASITLPTPEILNGGEGVVVTTSLEAEPGSEVNFPIGDTEVIYTATDEINEQVTTDTIIVTVNDTELPSITCLNDISTEVSPDANGDIITFSPPPFSDNCPDPVLEQIQGLPSGSLFPIGTTTIIFQVSDASGNLNTCSFNVTVTQANNVPDVTPILECVLNNGDGTLRAYFGYENLNEGEVEIPLGENNNFSGFEDPNQGQGIVFEAGRVSGAFSIVFPANGQVTWNLGTGSASASISSNLCNLTPILESECIKNEAVSGGDFAVDFGYENGESFTLEVPIGSQNQIIGGGLEGDNQGQPTVFLPGRQVEVFEVPFDGTDLFWSLNGTSTNVANTNLEPCSPFEIVLDGVPFEANDDIIININDTTVFEEPLEEWEISLPVSQSFPEDAIAEFTITGPDFFADTVEVVDTEQPFSTGIQPVILSNPDYIIIVRVSSGLRSTNGLNAAPDVEIPMRKGEINGKTLNIEEVREVIFEDTIRFRFELLPEELEFSLVNADSNEEFPLSDGDVIDLGSQEFDDIEEFAVFLSGFPEGTKSVEFVIEEFPNGFTTDRFTRVENVEPFSLFGDINSTNTFNGEEPVLGTYKISATAFSGKGKQGSVLGTSEVSFTFENNQGGGTIAELCPVEDAYLQNGQRFNNGLIRLETGNRNRVGYLQYDLSQISGTITSAQLKLTVPNAANGGDAGSGQIQIFLGDSNGWNEGNLNPNNAPAKDGAALGSLNNNYGLNQSFTFNLDPARLNAGGLLSLILESNAQASNDVAFGSSENAQAMCPTLILEIDGGGQVSGPRVTAFRLINAQNEQDLGGLSNNQVVDLAALGTSFLSVEAITDPAELEGSVVFELNGPVNRKQTENIFPYALFGDNRGDFNGKNLLVGNYTLTATPFSGKKGTGEAGTPLSISFQITNSNALKYTLDQPSALYPNPSEGEVFLDLHLKGNERAQVLIYDNQGQVINEKEANGNQQLSFQNMAPGIYMVRVIRENNKVEVLNLMIK